MCGLAPFTFAFGAREHKSVGEARLSCAPGRDAHVLPFFTGMRLLYLASQWCLTAPFLCFQDRSNIGNALIAGLPQDLKMTPTQVLSCSTDITNGNAES